MQALETSADVCLGNSCLFTFSKCPWSETAKHSDFFANIEASEQKVKTDQDWGEPSNKSKSHNIEHQMSFYFI